MRIAFASCANLSLVPEQTVWAEIAALRPDYLFLLGDQIYMDFWPHLGEPMHWSDERFEAEMRQRYEAQWSEPNFKALLTQLRPRQGVDGGVYGTWDDHDFAWNNANGRHVPEPKKRIARALFSEFVTRSDAGAGVQHAVPLRHAGAEVGRAIFLDTRWYRDEPGEDRDLLGEEQFEFLRAQLAVPLPLMLLCAGTPQRATAKGWALYPRDWQRYRDLVGDSKLIFLSGDIHENAFLPPSSGTRQYEIVSSGAAVKKFAVTGQRRNYGVIDWSPQRTEVRLVDKRGSVSYTILNDSFEHVEHEPGPG